MATTRSSSRRTKSDEFTEPEVVNLVQVYQDKAADQLSKVSEGVKLTPSETNTLLTTALVYATMANTEAVRAWYAST